MLNTPCRMYAPSLCGHYVWSRQPSPRTTFHPPPPPPGRWVVRHGASIGVQTLQTLYICVYQKPTDKDIFVTHCTLAYKCYSESIIVVIAQFAIRVHFVCFVLPPLPFEQQQTKRMYISRVLFFFAHSPPINRKTTLLHSSHSSERCGRNTRNMDDVDIHIWPGTLRVGCVDCTLCGRLIDTYGVCRQSGILRERCLVVRAFTVIAWFDFQT